jgi:hypothetical protein
VLLEVLDSAWQDWLVELDKELAGAAGADGPVAARSDQLAAVLAASLAARPMLCDLISAQAAMLAAYAADPALAAMLLDFTATLREVLEVMIAGLLARSAR